MKRTSWLSRRRRRARLSGTGIQSHASPVTSRTSPARSVATNATVVCTPSHKIAPATVSTMPVVRRRAGGPALFRLSLCRPGPTWPARCWPGSAARESRVGPGAVRDGAVRDGAVRDGAVRDGAVRDGAVREGAARGTADALLTAAIARRLARSAGVSAAEVTDACRTRAGRTACSPARRELAYWRLPA